MFLPKVFIMCKRSKIVAVVALLASGALTLAIESLVPSRGPSSPTKASTQSPMPSVGSRAPAPEAIAWAAAASRLDELEEQVHRIEKQPSAVAKPAPSQAPAPPDPAQVRRDALEQHAGLLKKHDHEAVDAAWARQSMPAIREDLTAIAEANKFRLVEVDCRTTTCTATLEWGSFAEAVQSIQMVAAAPSRLKCSHQITLPEPEAGGSTYRATVLLDCEADRTGL
jgi:hypothetical protein